MKTKNKEIKLNWYEFINSENSKIYESIVERRIVGELEEQKEEETK